MRVSAVELRRIQIPMKREFVHALHERRHTDAVLVRVLSEVHAVEGWGEVVPRPYVTGESIDSVLSQSAPELAAALLRAPALGSLDDAVAWLRARAPQVDRALAGLGGFDLALLDAVGRATSVSAGTVLRPTPGPPLPPGVIVGFEIATANVARYCATLRLAGKRFVKVKVGLDDDVDRLRAVAKVFKEQPIRIDANAAWSVAEAIERIEALRSVVTIASVEQPIAADDLEGLREIRERTGVRVMADESVCSMADARRLVEGRAADIFNVRLGKNGGLVASHDLVQYAVHSGIGVHLGTMVGETGILSAAAEIFGRGHDGLECLDGRGQNRFLLERDILRPDGGPGPAHAPGLGVEVDLDAVAAVQVGPTVRLE